MASDPTNPVDHAWRYFELHANQRMSVFNFFIVLAGFLSAGLAATLQGPPRFASLGIALGVLLVLLAYVFWQLDRRASFLVKHSEAALAKCEETLLPAEAQLFRSEPTATKPRWAWTYGRSFRFIFLTMAIVGLSGAGLCALRFAQVIDWKDKPAVEHKKSGSLAVKGTTSKKSG